MAAVSAQRRPERWTKAFGDRMTSADVAQLRAIDPFRRMDPSRFPRLLPLDGILLNDTRRMRYAPGEVVIREGDYGHSAFLILSGTVQVALKSLPAELLGRSVPRRLSWWESFLSAVRSSPWPEVRDASSVSANLTTIRDEERGARVFLQDLPGLLGPDGRLELGVGEIFGELAALSRSPRTATVVAGEDCELLEIRWQGLRDLLKFDAALRTHIHRLYRDNALRTHLRETTWLARLGDRAIEAVAAATTFESFGDFEWHHDFERERRIDIRTRIESEPLIAAEGDHPDGLILIRSGFARCSRRYDDGHRTLEYLGKGRVFGLEELLHNWRNVDQIPWRRSLRALGHVDILRIPTPTVETFILPTLLDSPLIEALRIDPRQGDFAVPRSASESVSRESVSRDSVSSDSVTGVSPLSVPGDSASVGEGNEPNVERLEFLVEHRLLNATRALVIDLDRCTRCDDCVRACASTHDNNPRFRRTGPTHDRLMFAQACLHCQDPVCMIGCPTGAIGRDAMSGVVTINDSTCIGCGTCAAACPYDNITMVEVHDRGGRRLVDGATAQPILKATKCDFCHGRPAAPACASACPHDALVRIELTDPEPLTNWLKGRRAA